MHNLARLPEKEVEERIAIFQNTLQKNALDGALLTQNIDIYYLTGTLQNGVLFIPCTGAPCFFVRKSVKRAAFETSLEVQPLQKSKRMAEVLKEKYGVIHHLGLEKDVLPMGLAERYMKWFPQAKVVDVAFMLRLQRAVKSPYEIRQLQQAAKRVNEVVISIPHIIQENMTELELSAKIEYALRVQGNTGLFRMRGYNQELVLGMVSSGYAAATPTYFDGPAGGLGVSIVNPQSASMKPIKRGEPILIDISTVVEGYIIDQTRMAVLGELDSELVVAYEEAKKIIREMEQCGKPGVSWQTLYQKALAMAEKAGLKEHFMGFGDDQAKFVGHGVGLELDELPILANGFDQPLEVGMVIAIEPKFTFPDQGVVGIENTYLVTENGLESLTFANEDIIHIPVV
ncbi:aminopeptidase P family protein [Hazenella sp. IB182357]|uniref:Aminopeptidase P family protein n=1 Tax=Polycladospora coralii TaxID=2771432 RepID=A0A926N9L3_9BACL|nr:Xaa-Pro peptidase family protein [Polycladospora coralii]MBD1371922.1 aminopeptidase P family protein [Polycladospora coralii]